jgi:crotonobetainyl-CoA:carnitine CoA-transferase CaiB-like acyl-CoA transferase
MTAVPVDVAAATAWARSGAMSLTGRPDGPGLQPPPGFVERLSVFGDRLADGAAKLGSRLEVDVLAVLGERAAIAGLHRRGDVSCGGAGRLLRTADGWLAVSLPRPDDLDLVRAWLPDSVAGPDTSVWPAIAGAAAMGSAETLADRAQLLGLAVSALRPGPEHPMPRPVTETVFGDVGPVSSLDGLLVIDLSSLWAGPLCTHLLQLAGARVVKVESPHRPDGARDGPRPFFDLLHAGQEAVAIDFRRDEGRDALRMLIGAADVVIEASRPRALEQLGISAEAVLRDGGVRSPKIWVSITGYGRAAAGRDKVAFGDDAAAAGGLVAWDEGRPCFLADAVADPCAGIVSAAAVLQSLAAGGPRLLDVSMRDVAAHLAGPDAAVVRPPPAVAAEPPRARTPSGRAPRLGQHTESVLEELRCR